MYIKVPALPSLNLSSTQTELDHNGLKQTEAELNRIQFSICYNGWLLSMFCAKENLKHRRKARGDQIGTTQQKNHNVGIQRDVSAFLESVTAVLCVNFPVSLYVHALSKVLRNKNRSPVFQQPVLRQRWCFWNTGLCIQISSLKVDYIEVYSKVGEIQFYAYTSEVVDFR